MGQDSTGQDIRGQDRTGQNRTGPHLGNTGDHLPEASRKQPLNQALLATTFSDLATSSDVNQATRRLSGGSPKTSPESCRTPSPLDPPWRSTRSVLRELLGFSDGTMCYEDLLQRTL